MGVICVISASDSLFDYQDLRQRLANFRLLFYSSLDQYIREVPRETLFAMLDVESIAVQAGGDWLTDIPTIALAQSFMPHYVSKLLQMGFVETIHPKSIDDTFIKDLAQDIAAPSHLCPIPDFMVGRSMAAVFHRLKNLLASEIRSIHVCGETGTGKELIADLIRYLEPGKHMITVNCASLSSSLLESELFGHTRGSFTGAASDKKGFIESANNGWLFLDEVNSLSLEAQGCLLRVIENQEVIRIGERHSRRVDFRLLTASNQDTDDLVEKKLMRADFQQRIKDAIIPLKPLRERRDEIPDFVQHFLKKYQSNSRVAPETLEILKCYSYRRGNIRELRSMIRATTESGSGKLLTPRSLPKEFWHNLKLEQQEIVASVSMNIPLTMTPPSRKNRTTSHGRKRNQLRVFWNRLAEFARFKKLPLSVKMIAANFDVSESSVSRRLREIVTQGLAPLEEVNKIVRLRLKEDLYLQIAESHMQ